MTVLLSTLRYMAILGLLMLSVGAFNQGLVWANEVRAIERPWNPLWFEGDSAPIGFSTNRLSRQPLIRWSDETRVVTLYVMDGRGLRGWQPWHAGLVPQALNAWQPVLGDRLSFQFTTDPAQADVFVEFVPNFPQATAWGLSRKTISVTSRETMGRWLVRNDIALALFDNDGVFNTQAQLQAATTHEMGHMLGITQHSPNPQDLMYRANTTMVPMPADAATLRTLYAQPADITNRYPTHLARYRETMPTYPAIAYGAGPGEPSTTPSSQTPSTTWPPVTPSPTQPSSNPGPVPPSGPATDILQDPRIGPIGDLILNQILNQPWRWRKFH